MVPEADCVQGISKYSIGWIFSVWTKKANAGSFERGCLKVTTDNFASWTLSGREKPPKTNFQRCPSGDDALDFASKQVAYDDAGAGPFGAIFREISTKEHPRILKSNARGKSVFAE